MLHDRSKIKKFDNTIFLLHMQETLGFACVRVLTHYRSVELRVTTMHLDPSKSRMKVGWHFVGFFTHSTRPVLVTHCSEQAICLASTPCMQSIPAQATSRAPPTPPTERHRDPTCGSQDLNPRIVTQVVGHAILASHSYCIVSHRGRPMISRTWTMTTLIPSLW